MVGDKVQRLSNVMMRSGYEKRDSPDCKPLASAKVITRRKAQHRRLADLVMKTGLTHGPGGELEALGRESEFASHEHKIKTRRIHFEAKGIKNQR